jgi:hypothetical protein
MRPSLTQQAYTARHLHNNKLTEGSNKEGVQAGLTAFNAITKQVLVLSWSAGSQAGFHHQCTQRHLLCSSHTRQHDWLQHSSSSNNARYLWSSAPACSSDGGSSSSSSPAGDAPAARSAPPGGTLAVVDSAVLVLFRAPSVSGVYAVLP